MAERRLEEYSKFWDRKNVSVRLSVTASWAAPPYMFAGNKLSRKFAKTAYWCHIWLAVIVCLALAMQIHLAVIAASGEVVGAGIFLLVMWLGIPGLVLTVVAIVNSARASDRQLLYLSAVLSLLIIASVSSVPLALVTALTVIYVVLVALLSLTWWRKNRIEEAKVDER